MNKEKKIRGNRFVAVLVDPRNTLGLAAIVSTTCVLAASLQLIVPISNWAMFVLVTLFIIVSPLILTGYSAVFSNTDATRAPKVPFDATLKVLELVVSPKHMDGVFEPMAGDFTEVYFQKLREGRIWAARWNRLSAYPNFLSALWMLIYHKLHPLPKINRD